MAAESRGDLEDRVRCTVERLLGTPVGEITPLAAQLGLRRFFRVRLVAGPVPTLVARVETREDPAGRPAGSPPEPPLEPIRALLERHGLPVPASHGHDEGGGIDLLEDVGDRTLREAVTAADPAARRLLYEAVCDFIPPLQRIADPGTDVAAFRRRLDAELFAYKSDLFARFVLAEAPAAARACAKTAFEAVAAAARDAPQRLAHRDLQSANIHLRADGHLVWIDLQGAFLAPPEYDLVCLLRDSYVELDEDEVSHQLARIRPALPDAPPRDEFEHRFDLLTISRKGKDLARFLQAASQRGDERFLAHVPGTVRSIRAAAKRAARRDARFAEFAELCAQELPSPCAP
jgi:aminoglycoside/choline kinase family phosphotransferase